MPSPSDYNLITEPHINACIRFVPVPLCFQETIYTCGVACVQSILACYGIIYRQDILIELLKQKPIYGTDPKYIIKLLQTLGFLVEYKSDLTLDLLKNYIDVNITPMLLIQAWKDDDIDYTYCWRESHYVIACGYDESCIIFMDPYTLGHYTYISNTDLVKRWHHIDGKGNHSFNCGLIIRNQNLENSFDLSVMKPLK